MHTDSTSGTSSINPITRPLPNTNGFFTAIYQDIQQGEVPLPSLPHLALRLRSLAREQGVGFGAIAKIVETDPGAASYVLKMANSPAFAARHKVENLALAVNRMGTSKLVNVVTGYSLRNLFKSKSAVLRDALRKVWINSARLGATSAVLARDVTGHNPDRALLAGLLANIGVLPLIRVAARRMEDTMTQELVDDVAQRYGHQVGITLLREWQFDEWMVDVVRNFGMWHYTHDDEPDLVDLVLVADLLIRKSSEPDSVLPALHTVPAVQRFAKRWPEVEWVPNLLVNLNEKVAQTAQSLSG